jgi:ubiquitin carboxyl-terminal hydrolase 9/24
VRQGLSEERPGLVETAARARGHYQRRAYACIKLLVGVMGRAPAAVRILHAHADARRRWRQLLAWLQDELDRVSTLLYTSTALIPCSLYPP